MLLSSAAEAMFWMGRYLERAQSLARTVQAYERLSLDLPGAQSLDLRPLLGFVGREAQGPAAIAETGALLHAVVLDPDTPSSVLGAVCQARANLRRGRVTTPPEVWATLNRLYVQLSDVDTTHTTSVLSVLEDVVASGSRIEGELTASMTRDAAYSFLRIGFHLERADMLVRAMKVLLPVIGPSGPERAFDDVRWAGLLEAIGARSMYRRRHHTRVDLSAVLEFLVLEDRFPRSLVHCLRVIDEELRSLPLHTGARAQLSSSSQTVLALAPASGAELPAQLCRALSALAALHASVTASYFPDLLQPSLPALSPRGEPRAEPPKPPHGMDGTGAQTPESIGW